jgi:hypothetical protein
VPMHAYASPVLSLLTDDPAYTSEAKRPSEVEKRYRLILRNTPHPTSHSRGSNADTTRTIQPRRVDYLRNLESSTSINKKKQQAIPSKNKTSHSLVESLPPQQLSPDRELEWRSYHGNRNGDSVDSAAFIRPSRWSLNNSESKSPSRGKPERNSHSNQRAPQQTNTPAHSSHTDEALHDVPGGKQQQQKSVGEIAYTIKSLLAIDLRTLEEEDRTQLLSLEDEMRLPPPLNISEERLYERPTFFARSDLLKGCLMMIMECARVCERVDVPGRPSHQTRTNKRCPLCMHVRGKAGSCRLTLSLV